VKDPVIEPGIDGEEGGGRHGLDRLIFSSSFFLFFLLLFRLRRQGEPPQPKGSEEVVHGHSGEDAALPTYEVLHRTREAI
jgi:hypothetical protein